MQSAQRQSLVELRPVVRLLAGLDLYKLADDLPVAAVKIVGDRLLLRLQA
jgi:hypothetical protein